MTDSTVLLLLPQGKTLLKGNRMRAVMTTAATGTFAENSYLVHVYRSGDRCLFSSPICLCTGSCALLASAFTYEYSLWERECIQALF